MRCRVVPGRVPTVIFRTLRAQAWPGFDTTGGRVRSTISLGLPAYSPAGLSAGSVYHAKPLQLSLPPPVERCAVAPGGVTPPDLPYSSRFAGPEWVCADTARCTKAQLCPPPPWSRYQTPYLCKYMGRTTRRSVWRPHWPPAGIAIRKRGLLALSAGRNGWCGEGPGTGVVNKGPWTSLSPASLRLPSPPL